MRGAVWAICVTIWSLCVGSWVLQDFVWPLDDRGPIAEYLVDGLLRFRVFEEKLLSKHCEFVVSTFFKMLGWATSIDKENEYDSSLKALGILIDLSEVKLLTLMNVGSKSVMISRQS